VTYKKTLFLAGPKKYVVLIALAITGCSFNDDLSLACSGSKDVMSIVDREFVERAVPFTISFRAKRQNKLAIFSNPIYAVTVDGTSYNQSEVFLFDNRLSGTNSIGGLATSFRFELDTRVLTLVEKSTLTIGKEKYGLMNTFTGKCS
jgi:hypothetical protein